MPIYIICLCEIHFLLFLFIHISNISFRYSISSLYHLSISHFCNAKKSHTPEDRLSEIFNSKDIDILPKDTLNFSNTKKDKKNWRLPIFPRRHHLSIFGITSLNFRVRNGIGCVTSIINAMFCTLLHHFLFVKHFFNF